MFSHIGLDLKNFVWDFYHEVPEMTELHLSNDEILIDFVQGFVETFDFLTDLIDDETVYCLTPKGERYAEYLRLRDEFENEPI